MAPEPQNGAPDTGAPMDDPALTGASDPDSVQMNQDLPPEQNPYVPQPEQPLQFSRKYMGKAGHKRQARYVYYPPFAMVDVGMR